MIAFCVMAFKSNCTRVYMYACHFIGAHVHVHIHTLYIYMYHNYVLEYNTLCSVRIFPFITQERKTLK